MTTVTKNRIDFLDFMRIFAFLSVLVGHKFFPQLSALAIDPTAHITIRYIAEGLMPMCLGGAAGVVVFFFISGYIITHVLQKEPTFEFIIKRVFRIYPLYVFAVITQAVVRFVVNGIPFPPFSILIPQFLLLGDFFNTPYTLDGVEWSLRVEVIFYVFMATMKSVGAFKRPAFIPAFFVITTSILHIIKPFPIFAGWSDGYLTLYGPFLFVGSIIYLAEKRMAGIKVCIASGTLIFVSFLVLISTLHPNWKESNYAAFSFFLFIGAWGFRNHLSGGSLIRLLSDLTFSVYLFHNWLWSYLENIVIEFGLTYIPHGIQTFVALLVVCYIMFHSVEKFGINLGRYTLAEYRKIKSKYQLIGI